MNQRTDDENDAPMIEARLAWLRHLGRNTAEIYPGDTGLQGFAAGYAAASGRPHPAAPQSAVGAPSALEVKMAHHAIDAGMPEMNTQNWMQHARVLARAVLRSAPTDDTESKG